uniref:Uncharacterized protein n=1 Tax=Romanomermis culicivorax TaxID=13658 RepID=A0A915HLP7_ROMCU
MISNSEDEAEDQQPLRKKRNSPQKSFLNCETDFDSELVSCQLKWQEIRNQKTIAADVVISACRLKFDN